MSETGFEIPAEEPWTDQDLEKIGHLKEANASILQQIRKAVVGQDTVVRLTLISLFSKGHWRTPSIRTGN